MLRLKTSAATVEIDPAKGASVTRYTLSDGREVLRTPKTTDPFGVASLPMVPWCNRLSHGVATSNGFHPIEPNRPDQACPLHGSGFQAPWTVAEEVDDCAVTTLRSEKPTPFDYLARQEFHLDGANLTITLSVTHLGAMPLPYGLGLHPWLPRTQGTRLQAPATFFQNVDEAMLPVDDVPIADRPDWDFTNHAPLPESLIDTCFGGWDGRAQITWSDRGMTLDIETDPAAAWYQVYSPSPECGFFCFEPVTHPIDAHNTPGKPGLAVLEQGETTTLSVKFRPRG